MYNKDSKAIMIEVTSVNSYYFSTHGGGGPLRFSFVREVEGFLGASVPNFPVFKKACMILLFHTLLFGYISIDGTKFIPAYFAKCIYTNTLNKISYNKLLLLYFHG